MSTHPSERVLRALAPFGLTPARAARAAPVDHAERAAGLLLEDFARHPGGRVALVTGPSGSGKSCVVRALGRRLGAAASAHETRLHGARALAEHAPGVGLDDWLGTLALAGLADARLLATPAGALSNGERARLRLAVAMSRARSGWLLVDEFCSTLDRETAAGVAASLRRWASRAGARVVAAAGNDDLVRLLGPDLVVRCSPGAVAAFEPGPGVARGPRVRIETGDADDLRPLSPHHYRSGRPAAACRVLRAVVRGPGGDRVAGVLVVSCPTLNGAWRDLIWPGRYTGTDRARVARRLNREVRRISRVIVDPRDRGRGIAHRLVRAYLDGPLTPATEAVASMGRLSPFGARAGMTAYPMPPRPADDRLADMLDAVGVQPWQLLDPARVDRLRGSPLARRELTAWARSVASSIPKPLRGWTDPFDLAPLAAGRLCAPPVAYGHVR